MNPARNHDRNGLRGRGSLLPLLCIAMAYACRGPSEQAPMRRSPEPSAAPASGGAASVAQRQTARDIEELRLLVEIDRRACELDERQVASLRSLVMAGRVGESELSAAETDLLQKRRVLHDRERQLAAVLAEFFVPEAEQTFRIAFESPTLPDWRIEDGSGNTVVARQLRISTRQAVRLVLTADRECSFEIPAMRVQARAVSDRHQMAWFVPVESGEYAIHVRSNSGQYDGTLVVTGDKAP